MPKFVKGKSGNPAGRRVGSRNYLTRELEKLSKSGKNAREVAEKLLELAKQGNVPAMKLYFERLEGRVLTAEELQKRQSAVAEAQLAPEQRKAKILELLRSPELQSLITEAITPGKESSIQ